MNKTKNLPLFIIILISLLILVPNLNSAKEILIYADSISYDENEIMNNHNFLEEICNKSFFDNEKLIICIGGLGISGLIMEAISQLEGAWPSVFWPEVVIIGITYSITGVLEREDKYIDMITIMIITSVLINSAAIAIDEYQTISSMGIIRIGIWICLFAVVITLQSITEKMLNIAIILGSVAGIGFYIGMVTGELRLVGDSFAIPNEALALIFAYSIIVWPWQLVSIANFNE